MFAGEEYGTGSSRDWAAKGTQLLGVKAVIAKSFERIHRSNLVGMGVLPCQFKGVDSVTSLAIDGTEEFDITGLEAGIKPQMDVTLVIRRKDGTVEAGSGAAAHRHSDRSRLLPARRHSALRACGSCSRRDRRRAPGAPRLAGRADGASVRPRAAVILCSRACACLRSTPRQSIWFGITRCSWSSGHATPGRCWW